MKRTMRNLLILTTMGLGLYACGAESEEPAEPAEEPAAEAPVEEPVAEEPAEEEAAEPLAEAAPSAEELPIAEDFEEEVNEAISAENYDDVLAQIEAELAN